MSKHEALKTHLLAHYEKSLGELLDNLPAPEQVTLSDLEKATGKLGAAITQATLQGLSCAQELQPAGENRCPSCGSKGQKRGKRGKQVITAHGEIQLERIYYVCRACGTGFFPPR